VVKHAIALLVLSAILAAPGLASAQTFSLNTRGLTACGTLVGNRAISGARFEAEDGTVVKLALVKAPELWTDDGPYKSWPHASGARDALDTRIRGRELLLFCEGNKTNRRGETVAHVASGERWLQAELVSAGHIFVFPAPIRQHGVETLLSLEDTARDARRGIWAYDNLLPVAATREAARPGWFQIVRGQILSAQTVGNTTFLNFGEDWRTDFTVEIPAAAARRFERAGIKVSALGGRTVEARGWLDYKAGPRLVVLGPGQLRFRDPGQ